MLNFRLAPIFTTNCVLQRNARVKIFGTSDTADCLSLSMTGPTSAEITAQVREGRFVFELPETPAGGPYRIMVSDGEGTVTLDNVMFGEVYLAGGQSNMEYELQNDKDWKEHTDGDENPNVRFYYTLKRATIDEAFLEEERNTCWELVGQEVMKHWSAVGYYFADRLAKDLGVTVGIIGCNWGATSASCWIGRDDLLSDPELRVYVDEYEQGIRGKSEEEQIREYAEFEEYHKEWEKKAAECYAENPYITWEAVQERCGVCKWPGPLNIRSPFRPGGLHETMIKRIAPYTMRGVIWYQGENDCDKARLYETLLTKLITAWRRDFQREELSFGIVQLAMHRYLPDGDTGNWPVVREAQYRVCRNVKNARLVLAADQSMIKDIHPVRKKAIGERLCDAVMERYQLPECIGHESSGSHVRLKFNLGPLILMERRPLGMGGAVLTDEELWDVIRVTDPGELVREDRDESASVKLGQYFSSVQCFELAGSDEVFYPATAKIESAKEIELFSEKVPEPKYVRYAWHDFVIVDRKSVV